MMSLEDLVVTETRLGEGGFGTVFEGKLNEIKVAAKKLLQLEKEIDNLTREASRLKRLQYGKHIAYIFGIVLKDENLYMVMEYSELGDLQDYLKKNKKLVTYDQKLFFCRGILLGLLYCHSMNVFHGDIKCSNVLLGKNLESKLTDFGLSMTVDNIAYYKKLYKGGLYWAAPELFSIQVETVYQEFLADPYPCDVYSLGATFCEISYDGTTEFIASTDEPDIDIMLGSMYPIPKNAFLQEVVGGCCQFERNERISLDECLSILNNIAEERLLIPSIDNEWLRVQQDIQANSKLELPSSFILCRPVENLVVDSSNLSLLEWLCINNCVNTVKHMIQPHKDNQDQVKWLYEISELCKSLEVAGFLQSLMPNMEPSRRKLSNLIDNHPQQFIEMLIKAGASSYNYSLLKKVIEKRYGSVIIQAIIDSKKHFKNWAIHDAVKFGNAEAVKILANAGTDLEWEDYCTGNTPLITAIDTDNIEIVKILLGFGVNVYSRRNYTRSGVEVEISHGPLHLAALKGNRKIVKLLIDAGATMNVESSEWHLLSQNLEQQGNISMVRFISNSISKKSNPIENNPLCAAIQSKQPDFTKVLISNRANIDEIGVDGYAPLHWAVNVGNEGIVGILIKEGADLDIRTLNKAQNLQSTSALGYFSECTPLHIAISEKRLGIVKLLVEAGADFSAKNGLQQAIMDIAAKEDRNVLEEIIKEYAPVSATSIRRAMKSMSFESTKTMINKQFNTEILCECLCIAASRGRNDIVKHLLKCRVNFNNKYCGKTPLGWAIFGENIQAMKILINAGADINAKNNRQETVLFQCIWESCTDMIKFLVDRGADMNVKNATKSEPIRYVKDREVAEILIELGTVIDVKNDNGKALLLQYISELQADMVQFLIDKGVDINTSYEDGNMPIHNVNHEEIMKILIKAGADINAKNEYGETPLIQHAKYSNIDMVRLLIEKGANVNIGDTHGNTPICYTDDKKIMEVLINAGADIDAKNEYGATSLIQNIRRSNTEIVKFLVEKKADVNVRDENGNAPIHHTHEKEIMKILINAGADINAKNQRGETLLIQYIKDSNTEMVKFLVEKKADGNAKDRDGNAPIHHTNNKGIMEILINAGADINAKDQRGETPLIRYTKYSNTEMVQYLIDKGADVNARGKNENAPVHHTNNKEIVTILINSGADINAKNLYEITPLIWYVKESNTEMVQFLLNKGADINATDKDGNASIHCIRDKEIAEILITASANLNAKNKHGKALFNILIEEQYKYLNDSQHERRKICELLEYLKDKNKV